MPAPDSHFIGWLPMPRAFARFLAPVAVGLVVGAAILGVVLACVQPSPGDGRWEEQLTTFEGVVYTEPYALIRVPGATGEEPKTVLLVEEGKFGATERVRPFDGQPIRVSGTLLHRDGVRMLEVAAGNDGIQLAPLSPAQRAALERPSPISLGSVTLAGEMIDPKCHLGAMKPGSGRAHKGCAVLCLRGGVPPMFVSRSESGEISYHLLTAPDRHPLSPLLYDRVGEPVFVSADREMWGDLSVLKVGPDGVRPAVGR